MNNGGEKKRKGGYKRDKPVHIKLRYQKKTNCTDVGRTNRQTDKIAYRVASHKRT